MLIDNHGREINYLRLAVTDRCNLRCSYCMPEEGLQWLERKGLLSYEEMLRLCRILVREGVRKIRVTGGEPFVRKDIMSLLWGLARMEGLEELTLTTNGVLTAPMVPELAKMGIRSVNLSLDTLDRNRFFAITRRDNFDAVMETMHLLLKYGIAVKLNAVVMEGKNTDDILPLAALTQRLPVSVRYIEEMPFNGTGAHYNQLYWDHVRILEQLKGQYPLMEKIPDGAYSTSYNYQVPGHLGTIGIIAAYTRSFCGTCNRIRMTPEGVLKTCLYGAGVLQVRDLLRNSNEDTDVSRAITDAIGKRAKDGWQAEKEHMAGGKVHESMASIGG